MRKTSLVLVIFISLLSCKKNNPSKVIDDRQFKMGFSTWSFGPSQSDVDETYDFIFENSDIYSEHMDDLIPWDAWINNTTLPTDFVNNVNDKAARKPDGMPLLLSVSFLNTDRSDIQDDFIGGKPTYAALNDTVIENAYFDHVSYLINAFHPDYLVVSIESNDLLLNNEILWDEYKALMQNIRTRIKQDYPTLKISESVTLHNWHEPEVDNPTEFIQEIDDYVAQMDFAAISFYPFFKGQHKRNQFQKSFDFLHSHTSLPISFVETNHLANDLEIAEFNLFIKSNEKEQNEYLETLLINADKHNYEFIIWWAYRDYDLLWETFALDIQGIGKLWRDTGLKEGDGTDRLSMETYREIFAK